MEKYNKILKSIVTWILTILLVGIFCTSVLIYPPYAFISFRTPQEKVIMIQNLFIPSVVILICFVLEYIREREKKNILLIIITLIFNIIAGFIIKSFSITQMSYFIAGINFNLIPACFVVMLGKNDRIKPPKILLFIFLAIQIILYLTFIVTLIIGSYVFTVGLMYLALPVIINVNIIAYINAKIKLLKTKIVVIMYILNLIYIVWYLL